MERGKLGGGGGTDGGNAAAAEISEVIKAAQEIFEKMVDAIGAGEDEPLVRAKAEQCIAQRKFIGRLLNADGGDFKHVRTQLTEALGEGAGLLSGAGHNDALTEERALLKPI